MQIRKSRIKFKKHIDQPLSAGRPDIELIYKKKK